MIEFIGCYFFILFASILAIASVVLFLSWISMIIHKKKLKVLSKDCLRYEERISRLEKTVYGLRVHKQIKGE